MRLRPLAAGDDDAVADIFLGTLALGRPLPFPLDGADRFASLCIGWYLDHGRADSVVAVDGDERAVGYGLVCTSPVHHRRWLRRNTLTTTARLAAMVASGEVAEASRRFYGDRLRDAVHLARSGWCGDRLGHAHVNLLAGARRGTMARAIRDHVDARCRLAGLDGWIGEVNAVGDRRAAALRRVAGDVLGASTNHTLSRLAGEPVRRLTVLRRLDDERAHVGWCLTPSETPADERA